MGTWRKLIFFCSLLTQKKSIQLQKALTGNRRLCYQSSLEDTAKGLRSTTHGKTSFQNPPKSLFLKVPHCYSSSPSSPFFLFFSQIPDHPNSANSPPFSQQQLFLSGAGMKFLQVSPVFYLGLFVSLCPPYKGSLELSLGRRKNSAYLHVSIFVLLHV